MNKNVGTTDRSARLIVAAIAVLLAFLVTGPLSLAGIILLVVAAVMIFTALTRNCLLYRPLGINTCNVDDH